MQGGGVAIACSELKSLYSIAPPEDVAYGINLSGVWGRSFQSDLCNTVVL